MRASPPHAEEADLAAGMERKGEVARDGDDEVAVTQPETWMAEAAEAREERDEMVQSATSTTYEVVGRPLRQPHQGQLGVALVLVMAARDDT